jgi:hypothetical protein
MQLVAALHQSVRAAGAAADPAARVVLAEERDRLSRVLRLHDEQAALAGAMRAATRRRRLYAYQKEGARRFLYHGRLLLLADDMGLGKTTQAIVAATVLYDAKLVRRGLLVVPAALKPQWEREWRALSAAPLRVVEGGAAERRALYRAVRRGFLVTNYEQVIKDLDAIVAWSPELAALDVAPWPPGLPRCAARTLARRRAGGCVVVRGAHDRDARAWSSRTRGAGRQGSA